jgi:signal transduction histidine kinase
MPRFLRWSTYRLRTKLLIVVALPLLPLTAFWSITAVTLYRQSTPSNNASRNLVVQAALAHVYSTLLDADAGLRDYVLTENTDAEARYEEAVARLPATLGALDSAVIDAAQRASLTILNGKVAEELALLARLPARSLPGEPFFSERAAFDRSKALLDEVRTLVITMERRQASLAETRVETTERADNVLFMILFVGSIACASGGVIAALVVAGSVSRRVGRLARTADRLAQGEVIEAQPAGRDEIDQLDRRFHEAACLLRKRETELRAQTVDLETANRELEAFSYSVSHDLRAPLRAIDGFSLLIEQEHGRQLDEGGRDALRRVRAAAQRMGVLIDELLNLSRLTRSDVKRERLDLGAAAAGIVDDLARRHPARRVDVRIEPNLFVEADPHLVRIALQNLLDNAWKYTAKAERARIDIGSSPNGDARVFHIRDNGAGFDMKYADKLFGAFQRLHSDRDFEGTGVGLAIVQRVVHRHGGKIWANAVVDAGAAFYFTLEPGGPEHA